MSTTPLLLLDGATGTEFDRRGVDIGMPLWSAQAIFNAPDVLKEVHASYFEAGADAFITNTFRTHQRSLAKVGMGDHAEELTHQAVSIACDARDAVKPEAMVPNSRCGSAVVRYVLMPGSRLGRAGIFHDKVFMKETGRTFHGPRSNFGARRLVRKCSVGINALLVAVVIEKPPTLIILCIVGAEGTRGREVCGYAITKLFHPLDKRPRQQEHSVTLIRCDLIR